MSNPVIANIILEGAATVEDTIITNTGSGDRVQAEGTLQDADVENRNKRIYAKQDLFPEVNGPRIKELITAGQMCGECGHPLSDDLIRQQTIDPKYICVRYLKIWTEGNLVKARFEGTNNSYGDMFDNDLRNNRKPAFSLRALGAIKNENGKAYVKGIKIITWDYVIYPSHKAAYTSNLVTESAIDGTPLYENQIVVPNDDPGTIFTLRESDARTVISRLQKESANMDAILNTFDGIYDKITMVNENTVMLTNAMGGKISVNLENHVQNLIMDYVSKY